MEQPDREYLTKLCGEIVAFEPVIHEEGRYTWSFRDRSNPLGDIRWARTELLRKYDVWPTMVVMTIDLFNTFCYNDMVNECRRGRPGIVHLTDILEEQCQISHIKIDYKWEGAPYCYVVKTFIPPAVDKENDALT